MTVPREKVFFAVLVVLLAGGLLAGALAGDRLPKVDYAMAGDLPTPRPQRLHQRVFAPVALDEVLDLSTFDQPVAAAFGEGGTLLVQDWKTRSVFELSRQGRALARYRVSPPEVDGPLTIQDFALDPRDGSLWMVFQDASLAVSVPRGDGARRRVELPVPALRVAALQHGFVVAAGEPGGPLFARYGQGERRSFGRLVSPRVRLRALTDGRLVGDGGDGVVYAFRYFSLLASYSGDGALRYLVETIAPEPPPTLVRNGAHGVLAPGTLARTLSVAVDGGDVYLLSQRDRNGFGPRYLDVYRLDDGSYLHSLRVRGETIYAAVRGDDLLLIERRRVRLVRMRSGGDQADGPAQG